MKYICLGYHDEKKWEALAPDQRKAIMDECFAYDDILRRNGHFTSGEALQSARNATTLRWGGASVGGGASGGGGKVAMTDGPYAETKEQLGGLIVLEATDLNHAIALMSKHPSLRPPMSAIWEVRPAHAEIEALFLQRT